MQPNYMHWRVQKSSIKNYPWSLFIAKKSNVYLLITTSLKGYTIGLQKTNGTFHLFKEGKDECSTLFAQALKALQPACDITIMFMPCSTQERYHTRFSQLAMFFLKLRGVQSGLTYITFTNDREPKHTSRQRYKIKENSNYIINEAVKGQKVVIVDDLLTTGKSLSSYTKKLRKSGAEVIGAIFLAKTFLLPSETKVKFVVWKHFFLS